MEIDTNIQLNPDLDLRIDVSIDDSVVDAGAPIRYVLEDDEDFVQFDGSTKVFDECHALGAVARRQHILEHVEPVQADAGLSDQLLGGSLP